MSANRTGRTWPIRLLIAVATIAAAIVALGAVGGSYVKDHPLTSTLLLSQNEPVPGLVPDVFPGTLAFRVVRHCYVGVTADLGASCRAWIAPRQDVQAVALVMDNSTPDRAFRDTQVFAAHVQKAPNAVPFRTSVAGSSGVLVPDGALVSGAVIFTRGDVFVIVVAYSPIRLASTARVVATDLAQLQDKQLTADYPDATTAGPFDVSEALGSMFGALLFYILLTEFIAWRRDPARRRKGTTPPQWHPSPFAVDVSPRAKSLRRRARVLTYLQLAAAATIGVVALPVSTPQRYVVPLIALLVVVALSLVMQTQHRRARRGSRRVRAIALSIAAHFFALVGLLGAASAAVDNGQAPATGYYAIGAALAFAAAGVMQRYGRRLSAVSAQQAMQHDRRRPVLYLRSFGDDDDRMRAATLGRRSLLERLSPNNFDSFEEVLARQLARIGPVVAVNPPGTTLPPIGAARETLPATAWQTSVAQLMDAAALILVIAPPAVASEGLVWELGQLNVGDRWARTVVAIPPLGDDVVRERWQRFAAAGGPSWPFRMPLPADPAATLALQRWGPGWRAFGAVKRDEWSYSAALRAATAAEASRPAPGVPVAQLPR